MGQFWILTGCVFVVLFFIPQNEYRERYEHEYLAKEAVFWAVMCNWTMAACLSERLHQRTLPHSGS